MAQMYSYATSQIQYNYQNFLQIILKIYFTLYDYKKNTNKITMKNTNMKIKFFKKICKTKNISVSLRTDQNPVVF